MKQAESARTPAEAMISACVVLAPLAMLASAMMYRRQVTRRALDTIRLANANNCQPQVHTRITWLEVTANFRCSCGVACLVLGSALTAHCWIYTCHAMGRVYHNAGTWHDVTAATLGIGGTALTLACAHAIRAATASMLNHVTPKRASLDGRGFFADATPFWSRYFGVSGALQFPRSSATLGGREARFGVGGPETSNTFCTLDTVECVCLATNWAPNGLQALNESLAATHQAASSGRTMRAFSDRESDAVYFKSLGVWAGSTMPLRLIANITSGLACSDDLALPSVDTISPLEASTVAAAINQELRTSKALVCVYVGDEFGDELERTLKQEDWARCYETTLRLLGASPQPATGLVDLVMVTLPPRPSEADGESIVRSIVTSMAFNGRRIVHIDAWTLDIRSVAAGLGVAQAASALELPNAKPYDNRLGVWLYGHESRPHG